MEPIVGPADAIDIDYAIGKLGIRAETQGVDGAANPVALPPECGRNGPDTARAAEEHMVELVERVQPVLAVREVPDPELVKPADAGAASILPPVDRVVRQEIPVVLANGHEHVVVARYRHAPESGIHEDEAPRHVAVHQAPLPSLPPPEPRSGARLEAHEIHVGDVREDVLRFVQSQLERT